MSQDKVIDFLGKVFVVVSAALVFGSIALLDLRSPSIELIRACCPFLGIDARSPALSFSAPIFSVSASGTYLKNRGIFGKN